MVTKRVNVSYGGKVFVWDVESLLNASLDVFERLAELYFKQERRAESGVDLLAKVCDWE